MASRASSSPLEQGREGSNGTAELVRLLSFAADPAHFKELNMLANLLSLLRPPLACPTVGIPVVVRWH